MIEEKVNLPPLPRGWVWTTLSQISKELRAGGTPLSTVKEYYENGTIPFVKIEDMVNSGKYLLDAKIKITYEGLKHSSAWLVPCDSLLYSMYASYGEATINKVEVATNQAIIAYVPPKNLMTLDYVYYYLKSIKHTLKTRGTTQKNLNAQIVEKIPVPLAPLGEQVRIVARLEELFTRLDAGVEGLRKVKAQLKRYRQAVLKYAFEGKLTEEWRKTHNDQIEPATKLLKRIKQERKQKLGSKYKEPPPIDASELPKLPENWAWTMLGEALFLSNERYNPTISEDERFVGLEHIQSGTGKLLGFGKSSETRSTKNRFKQGDLLYGKLRPYLNKVWVANFNGVCSTDILVFRKNDFISNEYMAACLLNQSFVEYTNQHMSGVQHPRVSYQVLSQYVIPLPPLLEQLKIAEEVQRSFSVADEVETAMEQNLKKAEFLRQSILKAAFEGKLVPQDPNDEPAEKLLERIKEERAKSKGEKVINKKKNKPKQLSAYVE